MTISDKTSEEWTREMSLPEKNVAEIEVLRHSARIIDRVVRLNVDGITQAESLIQPRPAGNCLNWVMGHLLCTYQHVLPMLEQFPVMKASALERYDRGSHPIMNPGDARELSELMRAWDETVKRVDAGLGALPASSLSKPAPFSPTCDPNETVGSLLSAILFHQAYHTGQMGLLRRIAGKDRAIG